jgi:dihydrodipicolinate synthase/N-acetylneuraminate lyase
MAFKKNPNAQALGRLGGKARAKKLSDAEVSKIASKGGKARAASLSAAERSRIAKLAVAARERKRKGEK